MSLKVVGRLLDWKWENYCVKEKISDVRKRFLFLFWESFREKGDGDFCFFIRFLVFF